MAEGTHLSEQECWELLHSQEFGRMAYELDGQPNIVPLNYAVDGQQLVFRTAEGSTVHGLCQDRHVAFEVDQVVEEVGSSVVVRGTAVVLPPEEELRLEQVGLRAWLGDNRPVLIAIQPSEVHGRRYPLQRPWRSMLR
ncbi:pyridoxamine 5'-phosphate oxidase family protein [Naumannella sp. ID2617S]|nr:pyridoxamine 5'-phosphate oxidase family protein [Naumannella sp. ID2617S]